MRLSFLVGIFCVILVPGLGLADSLPCVKVKEATVRNDPEKDSKKPRKLSQYTPLSTTGKTRRNWIQVKEFSGRISWIHRRDVSYNLKCVLVRVEKSKMFEGPGREFPAIVTAKKGEGFLDLGEGEDGWLHVENPVGEKSWIDLDHIWRPTASRLRMSFEKE
jgi:SH3-like domain-containing protein